MEGLGSFFLATIITIREDLGLFFLIAIITIRESLGSFFSCCHKYNRWWDLFVFSLTV